MNRVLPIIAVLAVLAGGLFLASRHPGYGPTEAVSTVVADGANATADTVPAASNVTPTPVVNSPPAPQTQSAIKTAATVSPAAPAAAPSSSGGTSGVPTKRATRPAGAELMLGMDGDATEGRTVFRKCAVCHSLAPGKVLVGPSLANVVDRPSGTETNFTYSDAMKNVKLIWDPATLDAYLTDPQKVVPGNHMPFPGLKSQQDRDDVIAYLASLSDNFHPAPGTKAPTTTTKIVPRGNGPVAAYVSDVKYTLRTGIAEGRMVYIGVGGSIDGTVNPSLTAAENQGVEITLINGEGAEHDITLPDEGAKSPRVIGKGASTTLAFRAGKPGDFTYFCSVPGHRLAGMEGKFVVTAKPAVSTLTEADIARDPADVPPPIMRREPATVRVDLEAIEVEGRLAEGTTYGYWTFNGKVPGPMLRVRVGDTVDVHLKNSPSSSMIHSVDFHAVTGPGGGAAVLQVEPGGEKSMSFKALVPGLYVYHCATPMVAEHIANGMYGMILVEPEEGMSKVDHEFYVMQGEIYTDQPYGQRGSQEFSVEKLLDEHPEYFVFNGEVGAISKLHPLHAKVGDSVRIYFGVGGPNFTSSFHVIGEIMDKVYEAGGLSNPPLRGIQTTSVPPGDATIVEFTPLVPGNYTLVDHALARMERGLVGVLQVTGKPDPEIYNGVVMPGMGH
jgi:nitrite reductase (NO-forming)